MKQKMNRAGQLYSDMLTACPRKQHRDNMQVVLSCFLEALGISRFHASTAKSPGAISRFLNHQNWSLRTLIRTIRQHALRTFQDSLRGRRGRPPLIEIIVDTTSISKEGAFAELDGWIHTLNSVRGLHVVMLYVCCGDLRLPWGFKIWRGKGSPSPTDLALRLVRQLPSEVRTRTKHVHLLADAGFSSQAFMHGVRNLGLDFTIGMRADRRTTEGHRLKDITRQQCPVTLAGLPDLQLWLYWIWLPAKKGEKREQRFIVSSRQRTPQTARQTGRRRWKIEALFKTLKSRFAFGKFGQKTKLGVLRYLCLSVACFFLCHVEHLDQTASGQEVSSWPDWGALAGQVRMKFVGWVRLFELEREMERILAVWDGTRQHAA
ncbi:transposase [Deinococcus caeni]|uniref:transposase n=3 Tax=Deinococcus TaxID=1298 RepID=UPI00360EFFEF